MKLISIIWLIFTVLFAYLSYFHYDQSKSEYPEFVRIKRPEVYGGMRGNFRFKGMGIDKPLDDFTKDFNKYLDNQNKANRKQNIASTVGYSIASLTAFISFIFSFNIRKECGENKDTKKNCNLNPYTHLKYLYSGIRVLMNKDN